MTKRCLMTKDSLIPNLFYHLLSLHLSKAHFKQTRLLNALQSRTGPVQGQNRVFPVKFSSHGETCFHYREPLYSLQGPCFHYRDFSVRKLHRENPVFITGNGFAVNLQAYTVDTNNKVVSYRISSHIIKQCSNYFKGLTLHISTLACRFLKARMLMQI